LIAACGGDEPGMRLEIAADATGAVKVEVYLATRACASCGGGIAPKGLATKLDGDVWLLDGDLMHGTSSTAAKLDGGKYVYDLRTPDPASDTDVAFIVVIGYDASGKAVAVGELTDVTIRHDATEWYRLHLGPATDRPSSDDTNPAGERVYVWHRTAPDAAACVGLETASSSGVKRLWLVPEDDTDCDEIDLDCDRYAYYATGQPPTIQDANCLISSTIQGQTRPSCMIGGDVCIDGQSRDPVCGPIHPHVCVPDGVCQVAACAPNFDMCLRNNASILRVKCVIPYNPMTGQRCPLPSMNSALVQLGALVGKPGMPTSPSTTCTSMMFADLQLPRPHLSQVLAQNGVGFTHSPINPPCDFGLTWATGNVSQNNTRMFAAIDLGLQNGNHMEIPLELGFADADCASAIMTCDIVSSLSADDGVTRCAQE
jgi:uncharacterized protein YqkB